MQQDYLLKDTYFLLFYNIELITLNRYKINNFDIFQKNIFLNIF